MIRITCVTVVLMLVTALSGCGSSNSSSSNREVPPSTPFPSVAPKSSISTTPTVVPTIAIAPPTVPTVTHTTANPSNEADAIPQLVEELMRTGVKATYRDNGPLVGYPTILGVVLLGRGDQIIANVARGLADVARKTKMSPTNLFPLGAVADLFAVTAILQLHEKGKLDLNAPIGTIIDDFPHGDKVTPHHLISHTSGLPHISDYQFENDDKNRRATDLAIDHLASRELRYDPGTRFNVEGGDSPTPTDYLMVRYVIERVSGQSYEEYLGEHIFQSAGMTKTVIAKVGSEIKSRALGYTVEGQTGARAPTEVDQELVPRQSDDGLIVWSTGEDLFRWYRALANGELIGPELVEQMFTPVLKLPGDSGHAGYGWKIRQTAFGYSTLLVANLPGYNVEVRTISDEDLFVVVLTSIEDFYPPRGQISWKLATLALR